MKAAKQWAFTIITDAIIVASAYYWLVGKVDGAGNIFMFIVWYFIIVKMIMGFTSDKAWFEKNPSAPGIQAHSLITRLLIIGLLVWIGYFWTAGFYAFASALYAVARTKEPKAKAVQ